jgi:Cu+-exporting ATPase
LIYRVGGINRADPKEREGEEPRVDKTNEQERLARIDIPVTGMTCASCVRRVERSLSKREGAAEARVNFATEKASVTSN